ncbi:MAG: sulfatase, partial [Planctomycetota bacterium]
MLAASLWGCGGASNEPAPAPNVLLFAVDTLRADRVGAIAGGDLTPRVDAFAAGGRTFAAAYTQATQTHPAMASVMTGLVPPHHGALAQGNRHSKAVVPLAEVLRDRGFATGSFVANLCQLQAHGRTVWSDGWDAQFCGEDETAEQYLWDQSVVDAALEWIDGSEGPFFAWIHLMDPHGEYRPAPEDWDYAAEPVRKGFEQNAFYASFLMRYEAPPDAVRDELEALYDAQIHGVDRQFGRVLDFLAERGLDDNTLVVFVSDHGEELFETWPKAGHGFSLTEGVLHVPLILAGPGVEPGRVEQVVETLQVTPTVLELLGVDPPTPLDGGSLLADPPSRGWAASFVGDRVSVRR